LLSKVLRVVDDAQLINLNLSLSHYQTLAGPGAQADQFLVKDVDYVAFGYKS
jgi:hypothetical protein